MSTPEPINAAAATAAAAKNEDSYDAISIKKSESGSGAAEPMTPERAATQKPSSPPATPKKKGKSKKLKGASATGPAHGAGRRHAAMNKLKATPRKISKRRWDDMALSSGQVLGVFRKALPLLQEDFDALIASLVPRTEAVCRMSGRKTISQADVSYILAQQFGIQAYREA
jgi:histone H3/H4